MIKTVYTQYTKILRKGNFEREDLEKGEPLCSKCNFYKGTTSLFGLTLICERCKELSVKEMAREIDIELRKFNDENIKQS